MCWGKRISKCAFLILMCGMIGGPFPSLMSCGQILPGVDLSKMARASRLENLHSELLAWSYEGEETHHTFPG